MLAWGLSSYGQCGYGGTCDVRAATHVGALGGVPCVCIAAGAAHSAVVSRDGAVYTFGWGCAGQLGHGIVGNATMAVLPELVDDPQTQEEHIVQVWVCPSTGEAPWSWACTSTPAPGLG